MRWHYRERMEKGDFVGTAAAYGYKLVRRELKIYEPEAEIVRRIFDMYLSGIGKQTIANTLNAEGIPRNNGKNKWYVDTVNYVLNNERCIGDALLQKKYTTEFPFQKKRNQGQLPQYYIENSHPGIISRETFEAAQQLQSSKYRRHNENGDHTLSGKIICPDCGHLYRRHISNDTAYWQCSYNTSGRTQCSSPRLSEEWIFNTFILMTNKLIVNREYILNPLIGQLTQMQNRSKGTGGKIYEIDRQIAELNAQNLLLAQHKTKGFLDAAEYAARTGTVNQKVSALRAERRKLLAEDDNDAMIDELSALNEIISRLDIQISFDEKLFDQDVDQITVSPTELTFKLIGGLELAEPLSYRKRR